MDSLANLSKLVSPKRLAIVLIFSLALSVVLSAIIDKKSVGMVRRGDFPAFYSAAVLAAQGQGTQLYSRHLQQEIENANWPSLDGRYYAFAYPPFLAFFLKPLASFAPLPAKTIFFIVQLLFFTLACLLLRERERLLRDRPIESMAILVSFAPLFVGIVAGQGAALNLLFLLTAMALLSKSARWETDAVLGFLLGLWLLKPQLALIAFLVSLFVCRPLAIFSGWLAGAAVFYAVGASVSGLLWPITWLNQTLAFGTEDFAANGFQMISLFAASGELFHSLGYSRALGQIAGQAVAMLLFVISLFLLLRSDDGRKSAALLLGPLLLLCGGHVLFYECGLLLPALFFLSRGDKQIGVLAVVNLLVFFFCVLRESIPVQPLCLLVLCVLVASISSMLRKKTAEL